MNLGPYRRVLALPGVARLLAFSVIARMPQAAMSIVLTLHVVTGLGRGYGAAGLMVGTLTVGAAIGAPWRGRAVDRFGLRRAMVPSVVAEGVIWFSAPFLDYGPLLAAMFVGGLLGLPVFSVVRQSLSVLVPLGRQRAAFALDSVSVELTYMVGPAAGVVLATAVSTEAALVAIGASMVLAGAGLMVLDPPTRTAEAQGTAAQHTPRPMVEPAAVPEAAHATAQEAAARAASAPAPARAEPAAWWRPTWLNARIAAVLAATVGSLIVLGGAEVAVVGVLRAAGAVSMAAAVFTVWSVASLLGGLVFGTVQRPVSPFLLLLVMAVLTVPIGFAAHPVALAVAIVPAGALCAPVLSATAAEISRLVPEDVRGEANGWYGSAMTAGLALGAPLAGAAMDHVAVWAGFGAVGGVGVLVAVLGLLLRTGDPHAPLPGEPAGGGDRASRAVRGDAATPTSSVPE